MHCMIMFILWHVFQHVDIWVGVVSVLLPDNIVNGVKFYGLCTVRYWSWENNDSPEMDTIFAMFVKKDIIIRNVICRQKKIEQMPKNPQIKYIRCNSTFYSASIICNIVLNRKAIPYKSISTIINVITFWFLTTCTTQFFTIHAQQWQAHKQ